MAEFDLPYRAARCVRYANDGNAVILIVGDETQRQEARALVGAAPVIVANSEECVKFLQHWMPAAFKRR
jgi:uncharacterized protein YerC